MFEGRGCEASGDGLGGLLRLESSRGGAEGFDYLPRLIYMHQIFAWLALISSSPRQEDRSIATFVTTLYERTLKRIRHLIRTQFEQAQA